jgi:hypothetical protein
MTMVRQHPQPQPPPLLSPSLSYTHSYSASLHDQSIRNAPAFDQRSSAQPVMHQQYAHPLSRHNSYVSQDSDTGRNRAKPPEHMLRRKTPNGTLTAAYDGTSVEAKNAHATKHILLPVTTESRVPYGLPLGDYGPLQRDATPEWSPTLYFETGSGRAGGQHALPQIDSMLNQIPPLQPHPQFHTFNNPFGGAPDPSLGPTASNDQGPAGPYWHDGTFIPYRPAAMRDPRFYHHPPNWTHPQHNTFLSHAYTNHMPNMNLQHHPYQLQNSKAVYGNMGRPSMEYPALFPQPHPNAALDYQNQPIPAPPSQRPHSDFLLSSGQSTPIAEQTPATTPLSEFGPQSINAQTREKVFSWAHTVYVDLLKYLQSTRKPSVHHNSSGQQQPTRPHIYPKPPRQPAADFSSDVATQAANRSETTPTNLLTYPSQSQTNRDTLQRPAHHRSPSTWAPGGSDPNMHRQPWHLVQQPFANPNAVHPQLSAMEPLRPLRRMSGSVAGVHQTYRPEVPPSMTAASALDAITKHCEESKWHWIDGILLGGCLAYALGDYQQAQDWYKHILKLDKE